MFVYWYLIKFTGRSPFSHSALDIKTMAMVMLGKDYRASTKKHMPRRWFDNVPHTHVALDDAIEQGRLFCNMLAENRASGHEARVPAVGLLPRHPRSAVMRKLRQHKKCR